MSTVFEPVVSGNFVATNGKTNGNGSAIATKIDAKPLGLNANKVVGKRYSLKDLNGNGIETWGDIVRRVVGHVSKAEHDALRRDLFYNSMLEVMLNLLLTPVILPLLFSGK